MRGFNTLTEREILALAISLEEEDERVYADYAERLRVDFPASAMVLDGMRHEESEHRTRLLDQYRRRFGDHVPLIRRQDIRGFLTRRSPSYFRGHSAISCASSRQIGHERLRDSGCARTRRCPLYSGDRARCSSKRFPPDA